MSHRPRPRRARRSAGGACEALERRFLLSTINWTNRATTDNFGIYAGNANAARLIVDRAIDDWERVIVDFNYNGGGNTFNLQVVAAAISGRGSTGNISCDAQGRPTSARVTMDDDGGGEGWYFDPSVGTATAPDDGEFTNFITRFENDFTGAGAGNDDDDFYRTIVHEIGHAMGILIGSSGVISGTAAINNFLTNTGIDDPFDGAGATLFNFNVGGGAVEATLTNNGGGHFFEGPPQGGGTLGHPNDLLNAGRTVGAPPTTRQLISDLNATTLQQAYGYTITLPSQINTFYANLNRTNNVLTVVGDPGNSADSITIDVVGSNVRVQVEGTSELIPTAEIDSVIVNAGGGNDQIAILELPTGLGVTVNAGDGTDSITVGGGDIDTNINSPLTINGNVGSDTLNFNDTTDGATGDNYTFTATSLNKGGQVVSFLTVETINIDGSPQPSSYAIQSLSSLTTLDIDAGAASDTFTVGNGDFDGNILSDISITGGGGTDTVTINDTADLGADPYQFSGNRFEKLTGTGSVVAANTTENVIVNGSDNLNTYTVPQLSPFINLTINGGTQGDSFGVAQGTNDLDNNILGSLTLNGGAGADSLVFHDTGDGAGSDSYTMTANSLSKPAMPSDIVFSSMTNITLNGSPNPDTITTTGFGGNTTIRGNAGVDTFNIDGILLFALVVVETGAGDDIVNVNADGDGFTSIEFALSETVATMNVGAGGFVNVASGGDKVLRINEGLTLGGRVNLQDNAFIRDDPVALPSIPFYTTRLANGYDGGGWNGAEPAFISTPATATTFALGFGTAQDLFGGAGTFAGQPVSQRAVMIGFTRYGDANLDLTVNLSDFNRLAQGFGLPNTLWGRGNFNYDATTNLTDFNLLATNFGLSAAAERSARPEPITRAMRDWMKGVEDIVAGPIERTATRSDELFVGLVE